MTNRIIPRSEAIESTEAKAALKKELAAMEQFQVWDQESTPLQDARHVPGAAIVRTHAIYTKKNPGDPVRRKVKCLLVAQGNRINVNPEPCEL